ncbi:NUDIX hydrolase [Azospirillum sp. A39]|uniref:NUDIX hydrolase n=1 Tax=Azospirillum sp. A39 TaxID=3462279 RepID=UPI0040460F2D
MDGELRLGLTVVIVAVAGATPRVVEVRSAFELPERFRDAALPPPHRDALPGAPFDAARFRTLQDGVRAVAEGLSGLALRYVEQLYTFGDRHRDPHELFGGPRALAVGYLALVRDAPLAGDGAQWRDLYDHFPWEDWRDERPALLDTVIRPALARWIDAAADAAARARRTERARLAFGLDDAPWDGERVLQRYELLYEAGLVVEAHRDRQLEALAGVPGAAAPRDLPRALGRPMARDGRRVLATALERLRGKLKYRPIVFELLPPTFTLHQLQQVVEALSGTRLHKQNFRRLMLAGGLVEPTGTFESQTGGRPAELHRYARQAILERTSTRADAAGDR